MSRVIDMTGKTVGRWSVLFHLGSGNWRVRCRCGFVSTIAGKTLRSGRTNSCKKCATAGVPRSHGQASVVNGFTHKYRAWLNMIGRIKDRTSPRAAYYAGVPLSPVWAASFEAFNADVPDPPSPEHTLDRVKNARGYVPGNVRWATRSEQCRNRRNNRMVTIGGRTQCLRDWALELNISESGLRYRIDHSKGVAIEKLLPAVTYTAPGR